MADETRKEPDSDPDLEEEEFEEPEPERKPRRPPRGPVEGEEGFVERAWETQDEIEAKFKRLGRGKYMRVLKMARKPEKEEFRRASQITAIGILVIGFIGFLILLFMGWLMGALGVQ